jgi:hypothetical protein
MRFRGRQTTKGNSGYFIQITYEKGFAQIVKAVIQAMLLFIPLQTIVVSRNNANDTMKPDVFLSRLRGSDHADGTESVQNGHLAIHGYQGVWIMLSAGLPKHFNGCQTIFCTITAPRITETPTYQKTNIRIVINNKNAHGSPLTTG